MIMKPYDPSKPKRKLTPRSKIAGVYNLRRGRAIGIIKNLHSLIWACKNDGAKIKHDPKLERLETILFHAISEAYLEQCMKHPRKDGTF